MLVPNSRTSLMFSFTYDAYILQGINCGKIAYTVVNDDTDYSVSWAIIDKNRLNIDVTPYSAGFNKKLRVKAYLEEFPLSTISQVFKVTLTQLDVVCKTYK